MIGTCALCLAKGVDLRKSHLLPSWSYDRVRGAPTAENPHPNPVSVSNGKARSSSRQIWKFLLCSVCEQRFGTRENYASGICCQTDGSFPLRDNWKASMVLGDGVEISELAEGEAAKLAYFVTSVVWRSDRMRDGVTLGDRYAEELRLYLNEQGSFPKNARAIAVVLRKGDELSNADRVGVPPETEREDLHRKHTFILCGMFCTLQIGGLVPVEYEELCLVHSATSDSLSCRPKRLERSGGPCMLVRRRSPRPDWRSGRASAAS
jgi:hypothetical protein